MILLKVFVLFSLSFFLICQTEIESLCLLLITETSGDGSGPEAYSEYIAISS